MDFTSGQTEKPLISPDEFWRAMQGSIGRNVIYNLCKEGRIKNVKIGKKFLIPRSELTDFPQREAQ